ncbi:MAG: hypothetical protein ACE5DX_01010 [Candidatus Dojkabacteria bacterium]
MKEDAICLLLMHSHREWQKMLDCPDVSSFLEWIWSEVEIYDGSERPQFWLKDKVVEYIEAN